MNDGSGLGAQKPGRPMREFRAAVQVVLALVLCGGLGGCLVIGGSSRGGFFMWPGGLGLLVIVAIFLLLSRRR